MKKLYLIIALATLVGCTTPLKATWTDEEIAAYRAKHPDCVTCSAEALKKDMEEHPAFYRKKGACQNIYKDNNGKYYLGC